MLAFIRIYLIPIIPHYNNYTKYIHTHKEVHLPIVIFNAVISRVPLGELPALILLILNRRGVLSGGVVPRVVPLVEFLSSLYILIH